KQIRTGADRFQVRRRIPRLATDIIRKQMFRDDRAIGRDESIGPERGGLLENQLHRVIIGLLDRLDLLVAADRDRRSIRIAGIFPIEDDIVGGERLAVMPFDALFQLPDDRQAILGKTAILLARNLGGKDRNQIAVLVPSGQGLVEQAAALLILGA